MSNKQSSNQVPDVRKMVNSVEWFSNQVYELFEQYSEGNFDRITLNKLVLKATEQAKAMHHKEVVDFVEDWYCNGPLLGGGVDVAATIEEHYNETFGDESNN